MPSATLVLHRKRHFDDGAISEMRLWLVPNPVRGSRHGFKYSLFYGWEGRRVIGYDNEPGKGDHRRYDDCEEPCHFTTPERLAADFLNDVHTARRHTRPEPGSSP